MGTDERASPVSRFFRRMFASRAELEAEELQRDAAQSGCTPVCDVRRGELVTVTGRLRTVVYTPRTTLPTLEAELYDGSDLVTLVWLGRRHIPGIQPGAQVTAKGRIAIRENRKVIYNPHYELEATT
jgi:RecJ-like exonuclease